MTTKAPAQGCRVRGARGEVKDADGGHCSPSSILASTPSRATRKAPRERAASGTVGLLPIPAHRAPVSFRFCLLVISVIRICVLVIFYVASHFGVLIVDFCTVH